MNSNTITRSNKNNNEDNEGGDDQKQNCGKIVRGTSLSIVTGRMCTWWLWAQNRLRDDLESVGTSSNCCSGCCHAALRPVGEQNKAVFRAGLAIAVFVCPPDLLVR